MAQWKIISTEARNDGSGMVALDVEAQADDKSVIPGKHASVLIPAQETINAVKDPKAAELIYELIAKNLPVGWSEEELNAVLNANAASVLAKDSLDKHLSANSTDISVKVK
jgi:hypothetical protein